MSKSRRPLELHENSQLLLQKIVPAETQTPPSRYTPEQMQEVLANTPMGKIPEAYADFYFLMQARVGRRQ